MSKPPPAPAIRMRPAFFRRVNRAGSLREGTATPYLPWRSAGRCATPADNRSGAAGAQYGVMPVIETSLGRLAEPDGHRVEFMVRTDVPIYQARLRKMGWEGAGAPGSFTRRLDDAPGVEAIFERFSRHIETMVRQSARLEPADWETGLAELA